MLARYFRISPSVRVLGITEEAVSPSPLPVVLALAIRRPNNDQVTFLYSHVSDITPMHQMTITISQRARSDESRCMAVMKHVMSASEKIRKPIIPVSVRTET